MTSVTKKIDLEIHEFFDDNGTLIVTVYQKGMEEPLIEHEIQISSVINDWLDVACHPSTDLIEDGQDEEMAENIIDELQDSINLLNDALRDYDAIN